MTKKTYELIEALYNQGVFGINYAEHLEKVEFGTGTKFPGDFGDERNFLDNYADLTISASFPQKEEFKKLSKEAQKEVLGIVVDFLDNEYDPYRWLNKRDVEELKRRYAEFE